MVRESEADAEADRVNRERVEAINQAEGILHDTESKMEEFKEQLPSEDVAKMKEKIQEVRDKLQDQENMNPEDIKKTVSDLQQSSLKLFEIVAATIPEAAETMRGEVTTMEESMEVDMDEVSQAAGDRFYWQDHQLTEASVDLAEVETQASNSLTGSDLADFIPTDGSNSGNIFPEINHEEKVHYLRR